MIQNVCFDDIKIGDIIPSVSMDVTAEKINRFAEVSADFNPIHLRRDWVTGYKFGKTQYKNVIGHGLMSYSLMMRAMTNWFWALGGKLCRGEAKFIAPVYPGYTIMTEAKVLEKEKTEGDNYVVFEVLLKNEKGEILAQGKAMGTLP